MSDLSSNERIAASVPADAAEVIGARDTHGEAVHNHEHIAAMWSAYLEHEVSADEVADLMILVKMSRKYTGEAIRDHYVDVCGYAGIAWASANAAACADEADDE